MTSPSRLQKQVVTSSIQQTDNTSVISMCSIFSKIGESENGLHYLTWQNGGYIAKDNLVDDKQYFVVISGIIFKFHGHEFIYVIKQL